MSASLKDRDFTWKEFRLGWEVFLGEFNSGGVLLERFVNEFLMGLEAYLERNFC